jgi:hypothetical protein
VCFRRSYNRRSLLDFNKILLKHFYFIPQKDVLSIHSSHFLLNTFLEPLKFPRELFNRLIKTKNESHKFFSCILFGLELDGLRIIFLFIVLLKSRLLRNRFRRDGFDRIRMLMSDDFNRGI